MVRAGRVLTAPFFVTASGPGSDESTELIRAWADVDLQGLLQRRLGCPALVANDADVHGAGVVVGRGLELVITLGTGFGTGLFLDGAVCPHLELAHHPFRDGETYNQHLGDAARRLVGPTVWNRRVRDALDVLGSLLHPDQVLIGGGNARHLLGDLPPNATVITQDAGLVGGVRLWRTPGPIGGSPPTQHGPGPHVARPPPRVLDAGGALHHHVPTEHDVAPHLQPVATEQ
jgi:polyphosphate glucokinase